MTAQSVQPINLIRKMETMITNNDPREASVNQPRHKPLTLWSEILPNLWQGGTDDEDTFVQYDQPTIGTSEFDSVYTLYAFANPVDWHVKEIRLGFYDSDSLSISPQDLYDLANQAHKDWKSGKRVLIRCQAGLNRSGIVAALVLIKDGYSPRKAIELLRTSRSRYVLMNSYFEEWLLKTDHSGGLTL